MEKVGEEGLLNNSASECGMVVVWRLKRGNGGEGVMVLRGMGLEFVSSNGKD